MNDSDMALDVCECAVDNCAALASSSSSHKRVPVPSESLEPYFSCTLRQRHHVTFFLTCQRIRSGIHEWEIHLPVDSLFVPGIACFDDSGLRVDSAPLLRATSEDITTGQCYCHGLYILLPWWRPYQAKTVFLLRQVV